ncbi:MAG: orotate phosphoribosyltransferase [Fibromonadaceae bacterium]|jgi:orotate phosphoribosyltransferase|nr:orotate phosphoribosyltransferase [Fibromonadaceae bacterium]
MTISTNAANASEFIPFLAKCGALKFGSFVTKSGRVSPYFVNMGTVCSGYGLSLLANCYAEIFQKHFAGKASNLFGPAYKGIPLCAATAAALHSKHSADVSFTYNRKEAKDHGEGGVLVGDTYQEKRQVVIIEDVITAGTSIEETMKIMSNNPNAKVIGLIVAIDRKEKLGDGKSALQQVREKYNIETHSIATIEDILKFAPKEHKESIENYRKEWGTT